MMNVSESMKAKLAAVTAAQIEALREEARVNGDAKQVALCDAAADEGEGSDAWTKCAWAVVEGQG